MSKADWENGVNLVLGVWLIIVPWTIMGSASSNWNFWIVGAAVTISAATALVNLKPWEEWINLALGVWLFLSPWILGFASDAGRMWNALVVGAAIAVLSGIALPVAQKHVQKPSSN